MSNTRRRYLRFSEHFSIAMPQSQLDFVDVPLNTDIQLYLDPYALFVSPVDWLRTCGDLVANYFQLLIETIKAGDKSKALALLSNLHEPDETRLGESKGKPNGRGWGDKQARELYQRLAKSKAISSGMLKDLSDFEMLIPGIGSDKISDLAINVIRGELVDYTQEQCNLHGISMEEVPAGTYWNPEEGRWEARFAKLPVYEGKGVILVPKIAVRRRLVPDYEEYYSRCVLPFLKAEHINANDSLVHTLKNGNPRVYIQDLRAKYKLSKEFLFDFSSKNPKVLQDYKRDLPDKASQAIQDEAIESRHPFGRAINRDLTSQVLATISPGKDDADKYHNFMLGALTEIFYPALTRPKKEQTVDEGRKRIDILFHNSAVEGFFSGLVNMHKYLAPYITVECKNYSADVKNPEFDQLEARLNRKRGYVGFLACRNIEDKALALKRCRDVVNNNDKKLIIVLEDSDIVALLNFAAAGNRKGISELLEDKLKEILT